MRPPFIDLLALPCAGASATMYLRWCRLLPPWIRVVPVELPGRGSRLGEPFAQDFEKLIARLCAEHAPSLRGRYAVFGHSMGALLAHGIARRQHELGGALPRALFVSACCAPSRRDPERFAGKNDDRALIEDLRNNGGTPDEVFGNPELLRLTLDTMRADYRLCESFRNAAADPLPVPIHALAGRDDDIAPDRLQSWRGETAQRFSIEWFDGGHFYLRRSEALVLAAIVRGLVQQFSWSEHAALASA